MAAPIADITFQLMKLPYAALRFVVMQMPVKRRLQISKMSQRMSRIMCQARPLYDHITIKSQREQVTVQVKEGRKTERLVLNIENSLRQKEVNMLRTLRTKSLEIAEYVAEEITRHSLSIPELGKNSSASDSLRWHTAFNRSLMDHLDYKMLKQMTIPTTCLDALFVFLPARATIKEMTKTMDVRKLLRMLAFKSGTKKQEIVFSSGETIGPFYEDFPGLKVKKVSDTGVEFELNEKRFSLTKVGETFVTYKIIVN